MNSQETELLAAIGRIVTALEALQVEYFIGGSVASSLFGEPRLTIDADLIAKLVARHAEPLVQKLAGEFYAEASAILSAIQNQSSFNLIHLETMAKVDVFVRWRDPFAQSQFARRQQKSIGKTPPLNLFFSSPEDTVLAKLEWYQKGGCISDRQWRDLLGVLKVQAGALDRAYLDDWANELNVADLLKRAIKEAGF